MGRISCLGPHPGWAVNTVRYLIAGAASGLFMASVFISVGPVVLFFLAKDPPPALRAIMARVSSMTLVMGIVVLSYPTWAVFGAAMGLLYRASAGTDPSGALGSPNIAFTAAVVIAAAILWVPPAILLRRVMLGVVALAVTFMGVFGWLMPLLAE